LFGLNTPADHRFRVVMGTGASNNAGGVMFFTDAYSSTREMRPFPRTFFSGTVDVSTYYFIFYTLSGSKNAQPTRTTMCAVCTSTARGFHSSHRLNGLPISVLGTDNKNIIWIKITRLNFI